MPSIVGAVRIVSVTTGAVVQFGDSLQIKPSSAAKIYAGSGSFLTGDLARSNNAVSTTTVSDPDVEDDSNNQSNAAGATN